MTLEAPPEALEAALRPISAPSEDALRTEAARLAAAGVPAWAAGLPGLLQPPDWLLAGPDFHALGAGGDAAYRRATASERPGAHLPHAAGLGWAAASGEAVVALFSASGAREADFHVGLNFAAIRNSPVVFVGPASARHALSYGMTAARADGTPEAVRDVVRVAVEAARAGHGPSLVEVVTS